jgi:hypothetical protein
MREDPMGDFSSDLQPFGTFYPHDFQHDKELGSTGAADAL